MDRLVQVVTGLFVEMDVSLTVFHIASDEENDQDAEILVVGIQTQLIESGIGAERIATWIERDEQPVERIIDAASDCDIVILGESTPSVVTYVFGLGFEQISDRFLGPVFLVQRERPSE